MAKYGGMVRTRVLGKMAREMVESGEDLRYLPTFRFLPDEEPRVTKEADLDLRYIPAGYTKAGTYDKRFRSGSRS